MTDDNEVYTPAQFREHQEGFGIREAHAHGHTGVVRDPLVSRFLSVQAENYDPRAATQPGEMPGQARDLGESHEIRSIAATETGRGALESGDMPSLKHLTGDQDQQADISGMKAIQQLDQIIEDPAPVIVIIGEMGAGKTDFCGLLGQRATHLLGIEQVASNIPTLRETTQWTDDGQERDGFVPNYRTMEEWVEQDGDPMENDQQPKLFIGDEFSSSGSGVGKDGYHVRTKMGPLVFKIRKFGGMLIYVAHDASSIHPLLWRLGVVIKKTSQKTAIVADKIKNGEIRDERFSLEGIPPTDWRYDTNDPAVWSWTGTEDDAEDEPEPGEVAWDVACWTAIKTGEEGVSSRDAAKFVPFEYRWIADRRKEQKEEGKHDDAMHRVEALTG